LLTHGQVRLDGAVDALIGEHRLLVGPAERAAAVLRGVDVVHESRVGRQATVVARGVQPIADPGWDARPITLEEVVLAYMQADLDGRPGDTTVARDAQVPA
jgi:ABC-2 type transport system ATP-binding protein